MNYLEVYKNEISPKLKSIDLLIKTETDGITIKQVADALNISADEVANILISNEQKIVDKDIFLNIMESGSSDICSLYKREKECGCPYIYSQESVSYIYGIDIKTVKRICEGLHIIEITSYTLPILLANIQI